MIDLAFVAIAAPTPVFLGLGPVAERKNTIFVWLLAAFEAGRGRVRSS